MKFSFHRLPLGICNCFLLRGEQTILVDAGAQGSAKAFTKGLRALNVDPKEISLVLLTHGHWDHIGALSPIQQLTGAKVAIHHRDQAWVESGKPPFPAGVNGYGKAMSALARGVLKINLPPVKVDVILDDQGLALDQYGIPGNVVYTPGHSMGHVSVLLDSGEGFIGDMAMNDWYLRLTPGLPILADDINLVVDSWKKILPMGIRRVYPAHGRDFPIAVMQNEIRAFEANQ
ncbi:MAG: MBL fold metallo-hydrolase [Anaerolineales bacterium]|nr:MBL fold metallo-hydrolase [Anaerolineales bacterium]